MAALQLLHVLLDLPHLAEVQAGVVLTALERGDHALGGGLGRAPRERRYGNVEDLGSGFDGGHVSHRRHPTRAVRVHVDRHLDCVLERGDQLPRGLRAEEA